MLETDGGVDGEGKVVAVSALDVTGEDQYAFVMDIAGKVGFPFDVDDAVSSQRDPGGDAAGGAEGVEFVVMDREAVDLADFLSGSVNEDGAFPVEFNGAFLQEVESLNSGMVGRFHVSGFHPFVAPAPRGVAGFPHDVCDEVKAGGEFFPVICHSHRFVEQRGHRVGGEGEEFFVITYFFQHRQVVPDVVIVDGNMPVKFGQDFEYFLEFIVFAVEGVIHSFIPKDDDLDVDGHRCRFQGDGVEDVFFFPLNLQQFVFQCPFELGPDPGTGLKEVSGVDDEVSAVCLQEGPGPNFKESGGFVSLGIGGGVNGTKEVGAAGGPFQNDRGAFSTAVVHCHVY